MPRGRWTEDETYDIPMTPLIDIIFNLILFFLVATTFYTEERDLDIRLPEGTEGEAIAKEADHYVINVRESGVLVVNNQIMTIEKIETDLRQVARRPGANVEVRGDAGARHGRIMEVMNLCKKTGVRDYSLTQRIVKEQ